MKGLGVWLLHKESAIPKAPRSICSKGKSSPPQKSPASTGRSVADCYDQMTLESYARSKDLAMVNTVEKPSVIKRSGAFENSMQRTEARSHPRNNVPVKRGKARITVDDLGQKQAGDRGCEKGGTQKFLTVYSHCKK